MRSVLLASAIFLASCGGKNDDSSTSSKLFDGSSYVVVDAGSLDVQPTVITGDGSLAALAARKEQGNSYAFKTSIDDGGSLTLYANSELGLKNGIEIQFSRAASTLTATIAVGTTSIDISSSLASVDITKEIAIQIDVHNDESPAHILVWAQDAASFDEDTALFNSETGTDVPGQGAGSIWGFKLLKSSLTSASVSEPKFEEE